MNLKPILFVLLSGLGFTSLAGTIYAPTDDAHVQKTLGTPPYAVISETTTQLYAGCAGSVGKERCSVIPVQLPDFGAVSDPFTEASFIFNYEGKNGTVKGNVDVYGLGRRASPTPLTNDFWTATATIDPTDATMIERDVITENSTSYGLKTISNSNLVSYLNTQYAGGAGAGDYVFFRLSTDAAQNGSADRYLITAADAGAAETAPRLVYPTFMTAESQDAEVQLTLGSPPYAIQSATSDTLLVGSAGGLVDGAAKERCVVMPFLLPDLGAVSAPFTNATFVFEYSDKTTTVLGNVDVYGLGRRASPAVLTNDYWTATATVDPTDATLIAENIITENSSSFGIKTVTHSNLVHYLNTQYANGAGAGEYVFLRLGTDKSQSGGVNRYYITSTEGATAETMPRIVYNGEYKQELTSNRPFIWATMEERDGILDKIANYSWAAAQKDSLIARVQSNLNSYLADRDAYLRALPINWSLSTPQFYTTVDQVNNAWRNKLDMAQDCSVIYYLTGDTRYAELAADVLHNSVRWLLETPKSSNTSIGGWTFHDVEWLYESRSIGSQMPIIYDFVHAYLLNNTVYDVHEGTEKNFSFTDAQSVFIQMRNLTRDRGYPDTNWCSLMGDSMILNTLAIDDEATRNTFVDEFLHKDFPRQDSIEKQENHFDGPAPYSCYPESLGYSKGVVERDSYYVSLLDRYDPGKNYPAEFPKLIQSLHRTKQMHYPRNSYQVQFGDGHRMTGGGINYALTDILYSQAVAQGRTDLMALYGGPLAEGITSGKYNRNNLQSVDSLSMKNQVLTLLWGAPEVIETPKTLDLFRTDTLPYAGLVLQRNFSPNGNVDDGLMSFVQGGAHVHSHASGMNMELYGCGKVLGVKGYGRDYYARSFASANTVIVNGYSRGVGGWSGVGINTVQIKSMEPATRATAVSSNLSFTCTTFLDNKGDGAEATQERTMAVIRTSPTTGFYFDLFRSNSSLSGEYHDYLYHNIGTSMTVEDSTGTPLSFTSQPNRFVNDTDSERSPGWGYLLDTKATGTVTDSVRAQFATPFSGSPTIYMNMHIPGDSAREYATAMGPSDGEHPSPYDTKNIPTLIIRRTGQAWDNPFSVIFEPHQDGADGGTVQHVTTLKNGTKVVGMKVESIIDGKAVTHYIIANTGASDTYTDAGAGFSFTGRFGIVADFGHEDLELYIGDGSAISYGDYSMTALSGNTQASMVVKPGQEPVINANDPVSTTQSAPLTSGLVAHWSLDEGEGTVATDVTGNGFDGLLQYDTTWGSDAERGTYVVFDGTDDRIATPFKYALADTNNFTWAWWAKMAPDSHPNSIMVGNRYGNTGDENLEFIKMMPPKASFSNTDSADTIEDYDYADLPSDEWHHYAMVKSGTSFQWYVDGVAQGAPVTINYNETTPIPFMIGGDGVNKPNECFKGGIDDVVLYREALTAEEVGYVKNGFYPYTPLNYELLAGWETWDSNASAPSMAATGISGSSDNAAFGISKWGASTDGTFGTLESPSASAQNDLDEDGLRITGATEVSVDFTVENISGRSVYLGAFYFDTMLKADNTGPNAWRLEVLSGGITLGEAGAGAVGYESSGSDLKDYEVDLSLLEDHKLDAGENAVFRLSFSGGIAANAGKLDLDNVALTGAFFGASIQSPTMLVEQVDGDLSFSWSNSMFKLQYCTNLLDGAWTDYEGGTSSPVTVSPTNRAVFFRLIEMN